MRVVLLICALALLVSCSREEPKKKTATSGTLIMSVTHEYADLIDSLASEFARQNPEVLPTIRSKQTREAVVDLLNDSVQTVCIDRELNDEEMQIIEEAGMAFTTTCIAWDALVAIVNRSNRTPRFTKDMLTSVVTGRVVSWSGVQGSGRNGPVEFVTTERNTGLYENVQSMLGGQNALSVFAIGESQEECMAYVGRSADAVALVSLREARNLPSTVRIVPLETLIDSVSGTMADIMPSQTTVYTGEYGLRHGIYLMTTERRVLTGSGFSTFLLRTQAQKIVQKSGLLPAVIPTRVIQLTSE